MAIRDRLRRTFRSKKSASEDPKADDDGYPPRRKDIEYYKPNEIPKSKYRGKVDPVHQERLESYSFAQAFDNTRRKPSVALSGTFSPGGTQAMSAAQSRRSSWSSREPSSTGSAESNATSATSTGSIYQQIASATSDGQLKEPSGRPREKHEDKPSQVDDELSRAVTATDKDPPDEAEDDPAELCAEKTVTQARRSSKPQSTPFSADELERAMTRATLRPRRGTVIGDLEEVVVP